METSGQKEKRRTPATQCDYDFVSIRSLTQEDPLGLAGGLNLNGYAAGDPVNFSDPFGLQGCSMNDRSDCPILKVKVSVGLVPPGVKISTPVGRAELYGGPKAEASGTVSFGTGGTRVSGDLEGGLEAGAKAGGAEAKASGGCSISGGCDASLSTGSERASGSVNNNGEIGGEFKLGVVSVGAFLDVINALTVVGGDVADAVRAFLRHTELRTNARMLRPSWIKVVAWFELWGGIWGILATAQGVYEHAGRLSAAYVAVAVLAFSFFSATAFAGYELARRHRWGWRLSSLLLLLQVVQFSAARISYAAYVGAAVTAGVSGWVLQAGGDIGSLFRIRILEADSPFTLTVNFVAVAAILMLKTRGSHSDSEGGPAMR